MAMEYVAKTEKIENVQSLRKLAQVGFEYYLARAYRDGRISLREASKRLQLTLSQAVDLFSEMGVRGAIRSHDVQASLASLLK
jgi:hypothetical protein